MTKSDNIRSAQFVDSYYPVIDGVVQVVHNYASIMNRISYSCVVCPRPQGAFDDSSLPYDVFRTRAFTSSKWQYSVAKPWDVLAPRLISEAKPDILHVHSPFTQRTCALKLARMLRIPVAATFHTKYYDDVIRMTHSPHLARTVINNIVAFYNRCDSVWACSDGAARTLRDYGYKGEITVMENGTDFQLPEDPEAVAQKAAQQYHITKDTHNLLFVGTQVWQKNMRLVLDTMKLLCDGDEPYRLLVAGCGGDEHAIHEYAEGLGLGNDQVSFLGKVSDHELLSGLFLNADLFFFPSVYDTSALVLREASMLGTPSLLTEGSDAAGKIIPDVNGFVAQEDAESMADKIRSVINDKALLDKTGAAARDTIPILWEDLIPDVMDKYAEIIDRFKGQ